ncbi:phosphatase PAP2 family protein [Chitinibacter sp. SCUT-21]|uniref:phosphatase PAP2 family protein n=1 Tax=Chitinibacter sp. SCUT-21 TaxID=2970891 RepID=UPI0035A62026
MAQHSLRFYCSHILLPLVAGAALLWLYPQTQWDVTLTSWFYDPNRHVFPLKNHFFLDAVMHTGLKSALWFIPITLLSALIWSRFASDFVVHRRRIIWMLLGLLLSTALIQVMKRHSIHACPWDLQLFGGQAPLLPLLGRLPLGVSPGRCFPGGHASGGFALLVFYFALRDDARKYAWIGFAIAIGLGFAMGWSQMMRGAHFLSHNLWTLWWVWIILVLLYIVWPPVLCQKIVK